MGGRIEFRSIYGKLAIEFCSLGTISHGKCKNAKQRAWILKFQSKLPKQKGFNGTICNLIEMFLCSVAAIKIK